MTDTTKVAIAAAVLAEREACADEIDCGCPSRQDMLERAAMGSRYAADGCRAGGDCFAVLAHNLRNRPAPDGADALAAALTKAREEGGPWRDEIDTALIVREIGTADTMTPREAIGALMDWEVMVALDPKVSADARALIAQGREEGRREIEHALRELEEASSLVDQVMRQQQRDPAWGRLHAAMDAARAALAKGGANG